jgi:hypothetical protein
LIELLGDDEEEDKNQTSDDKRRVEKFVWDSDWRISFTHGGGTTRVRTALERFPVCETTTTTSTKCKKKKEKEKGGNTKQKCSSHQKLESNKNPPTTSDVVSQTFESNQGGAGIAHRTL